MKVVIVGGVAGGASAAARARRLDEKAEIVLLERGPNVSFANCGLPYYMGGEIADRDRLLVVKPELLVKRFRLDVRTQNNVLKIDREAKTVRVRNLETGQEYDESYDKLILSPGAAPLKPPLPGVDLPAIFTLRTLEDVDRITKLVMQGLKRAVVVGAGFIGLEVTENLIRRGVETTLIELQDQVLPPLDREMAVPITETLKAHGVRLRLGQSATGFEQEGDSLVVTLQSGEKLSTQMVLLGIGVRPENQLALDAGLAVAQRGGIQVNEHMQTTDPDIYAVGDAVEVKGFVSGQPAQVPLGGPANRQGRIAADHIFGLNSRYRGTQGTAIVRVFDRVAGMTGESEKSLHRIGMPYLKVYVHPAHHAGYYPGARPMTLKLLFSPSDGKILGAQVVGEKGVDKRIDVLAMAIQAGFTVYDLEESELAYAPQFGSAKDPVNMAGFVAAGLLRGEHPQRHFEDLETLTSEGALVVDVRTPEEYEAGSVPGALNVPVDELRERLDELPTDRKLLLYCGVGLRGYVGTRLLRHLGRDATNLSGGYRTYRMVEASKPG